MATSRADIFRGALSLNERDRADLIAALIESRKSRKALRKLGVSILSGVPRTSNLVPFRAFHGR
jgi:hypothetical protein